MTGTPRTFVLLCANGRDRDDAKRLGLVVAGFDRVELLVLATAERTLRGLTIDGWAITAWARHELEESLAGYRIHAELLARWRRPAP